MDSAPGALPAPWLPAPLGGWAPPAPTPRPRCRSLFPAPAHPVLCLGGQRSSPGWSDVWGRECVVGPQGSAFREGMGGHTHRGSRGDSGELSPSGPGGRAALMCPLVSNPPPAHSHLGPTHAGAPVAKLDSREALSDPLLVPPQKGGGSGPATRPYGGHAFQGRWAGAVPRLTWPQWAGGQVEPRAEAHPGCGCRRPGLAASAPGSGLASWPGGGGLSGRAPPAVPSHRWCRHQPGDRC